MTKRLVLLGDPPEREIVRMQPAPEPGPVVDTTEMQRERNRRFVAAEHERTERIRAMNGLPPLYTPMPEEGACCPWEPR